jgi:hypothetical protein
MYKIFKFIKGEKKYLTIIKENGSISFDWTETDDFTFDSKEEVVKKMKLFGLCNTGSVKIIETSTDKLFTYNELKGLLTY